MMSGLSSNVHQPIVCHSFIACINTTFAALVCHNTHLQYKVYWRKQVRKVLDVTIQMRSSWKGWHLSFYSGWARPCQALHYCSPLLYIPSNLLMMCLRITADQASRACQFHVFLIDRELCPHVTFEKASKSIDSEVIFRNGSVFLLATGISVKMSASNRFAFVSPNKKVVPVLFSPCLWISEVSLHWLRSLAKFVVYLLWQYARYVL